ncbi:uncharacterized protein OCT59_002331 [Rhizophagus irregularis]|uniref:uncharacterized protein n=1 Tax=Rhizophagus irregularis TaxID=588596 RepID=UPI000CB75440|nr:hypothetical protein OCT59_002331 [Rhizophagus irregularis]
MTYSKLFSGNSSELGNLPELLCEIIQYFRNDLSTLYSCVLVNKLWCRLAIPLLWEDPFSIYAQNFQFIDIYLCNLNEDDKTKFNEYVKQKLANIESISNCSIYRLLFKMFIENEGNLHSFEVEVCTSNDCNCLKDIMELILQNPNFNCNIRNLMFSIDVIDLNTNIFSLLKFLCFNCNSISSFYIGYEFKEKTIHIIYCSALNSDFVQQIINVIRPFKLKSLILSHHPFQVESLQLLLQKFGSDLENFEFGKYNFSDESKQKLFKSIIEYCTKIKYFSLKDINFNLALNLIENIKKQNLNYLNISFDYYGDDYKSENLGQILPTKLEFLKLDNIKSSDLKKFLENSQDTFIKRLFIRTKVQRKYLDSLPYIKKYIMKKKRVKYLAILFDNNEFIFYQGSLSFNDLYTHFNDFCNFVNKDLVSLEDEVKEFELYNIKVQKYDIKAICEQLVG